MASRTLRGWNPARGMVRDGDCACWKGSGGGARRFSQGEISDCARPQLKGSPKAALSVQRLLAAY